MIRPLRQRHRAIFFTLGALLPIVFAVGLAGRKSLPMSMRVPSGLIRQTNDFSAVVWTKPDLWKDQRVKSTFRGNGTGAVEVEFQVRDWVKPDVLVYWIRGPESIAGGLPAEARLLGPLSKDVPLPVPAEAHNESGRFIFYSLADNEVVLISNAFLARKD